MVVFQYCATTFFVKKIIFAKIKLKKKGDLFF